MEQMVNKEGMGMEMAGASMAAGKKEGKGMMMGMMMCVVLAIAGIGFGVYEFMQAKSAKQQIADLKIEIKKDDGTTTTIETDKIEIKEDDKTIIISDLATTDSSIVSTSLEKTLETPWPEEIPRMDGEPETLTVSVSIPQINIDNEAAEALNRKIYEKYSPVAEEQPTFSKGPYDKNVSYDYIIRDDIIYIIIKVRGNSYRATSSADYDVYYYDINSNTELSVADIATRFNLRQDALTVIPAMGNSFDVYFRDQQYCYAMGCIIIENTY